jgi:hypothetical protein
MKTSTRQSATRSGPETRNTARRCFEHDLVHLDGRCCERGAERADRASSALAVAMLVNRAFELSAVVPDSYCMCGPVFHPPASYPKANMGEPWNRSTEKQPKG